ncbi:hypothetical protein DRH14_04260 [Candidatus Shapirobacteria bacterium]|nr:MAG: hypothetical protein DRH14_04260 [Candidatus Shapirobacteria bacterium]
MPVRSATRERVRERARLKRERERKIKEELKPSFFSLCNRPKSGPYRLEEDKIIVAEFGAGSTPGEITKVLKEAGFQRTPLSVNMRIKFLKKSGEGFDTIEAFHEHLREKAAKVV